jgi:hypothetical protein
MGVWQKYWRQEREEVGWRFWVAWVVLTNIGFFGGLAIGRFLAGLFVPETVTTNDRISEAIIVGAVFATLVGLLQGILLQRHGVPREPWTLATGFGWIAGTALAAFLLITLNPETNTADWFGWIIPAGIIAGAVVGVPQWLVLRNNLNTIGWWWIIVSSISWGIFLPGVVSGLVLARFLPKQEPQKKRRRKSMS